MFQIKEAIFKNVCSPDGDEHQDFTVSRSMRASSKREGDSQLRLVLFVGICQLRGFGYHDIASIASLQREEYLYKLSKYKRKSRSNDKRFLNKIKLVNNYLKLTYGI
jgi:hypothetical protein